MLPIHADKKAHGPRTWFPSQRHSPRLVRVKNAVLERHEQWRPNTCSAPGNVPSGHLPLFAQQNATIYCIVPMEENEVCFVLWPLLSLLW